jgi:hypothetical protein
MRDKTKLILLITVACLAIIGLSLACSSLSELAVTQEAGAEEALPTVFQISGLSIVPAKVTTGEPVFITAKVTNTGETDGICEVELKINDVSEASNEVAVPAGGTQNLIFSVSRDVPGIYQVALGKLAGEFAVAERTATQYSDDAPVGLRSTNSGCCGGLSGPCGCGATNSSSALPQQSTSCGCGK